MTSGPTEPLRGPGSRGSCRRGSSVAFSSAIILAPSIRSAMRARLSSRPSRTRTSNMPGEVARPVSAARSGCATWPSLTPAPSATAAHRRLCGQRRPFVKRRRAHPWTRASRAGASPASSWAAFSSKSSGRCSNRKIAPSASSLRFFARGLSSGIALDEQLQIVGARGRGRSSGADPRRDQAGEAAVVGLADIMAVEILELLHVEARRRLADSGRGRTSATASSRRDDLVVAMAPAEAEQIIEQRLGQDAELVAIFA